MVDAIVDYAKTGMGNLLRQDAYNRMGLADFVRRVKSGQIKPTVVDEGGKVVGGAKRGLNSEKKSSKKGKHRSRKEKRRSKGRGNITQKVVVNVKTGERRRARQKAVAPALATAGGRTGRVPFGGGMAGGMITPLQPYQMSNPLIQRSGFSTIQATPQRDVSAEHQLAKVLQATQEIASAVQKPSPALLEMGKIKTNPMAEMKPHSGTASVLTQRIAPPPSSARMMISEPESEGDMPRITLPQPPQITEVPRRRRKDAEIASQRGITLEQLKAERAEKKASKSTPVKEAPPPSAMTPSDVEVVEALQGARRGLNKRRRVPKK